MKALYVFIIITSFYINTHAQDNTLKLIESSTVPVIINGILDQQEWLGAKELTIKGEIESEVTVLLKYDKDNLYVAFRHLTTSNNINRNVEVLLNTNTNIEDTTWSDHCYWFHSSYSNCSAAGQYYYWENCTTTPIGWMANTFPFKNGNNNIEFMISFSKLNLSPEKGQHIKIAFKISNPLEQHSYWPETAIISDPSSWGDIVFKI